MAKAAGLLRLSFDTIGIYVTFLTWGLLQERLTTTPYTTEHALHARFFRYPLVLNTVQSAIACIASLVYLLATSSRGQSFASKLGLQHAASSPVPPSPSLPKNYVNGVVDKSRTPASGHSRSKLLFYLVQCAAFQSIASFLGISSTKHIDYPTVILGKSSKLVPVIVMNFLIYRRRFAVHKYIVVAMVTFGISLFMLCAPASSKASKGPQQSSSIGIALLVASLAFDGWVNSTQDEVFQHYKLTGSQMMFWMNLIATALTLPLITFNLPNLFNSTTAATTSASQISAVSAFVKDHPAVLKHVLGYGCMGAAGQLFIFDTLQHFGSLTLVTITVTRKLFTMLLSVAIFNHALSFGQWGGVALVFAGIGLEALHKRKGGLSVKVVDVDSAKARLKAI